MQTRIFAVCAVALASGALAGCRTATKPPVTPVAATAEAKKVAAGYNEFGFRLLRTLAKGKKTENVCLSPFSVATALAMTANGTAGQTRRELDTLLGVSGLKPDALNAANQNLGAALHSADSATTLSIANSLWASKTAPIEPKFLSLTKQFFDAPTENADLQSADTINRINAWAKEKTEGKIPTIVDEPLSPNAILVLLNAVYFKGTWTEKFDAAQTKRRTFHALDGDLQRDFMEKSGPFSYFENETLQAVALPYGNEAFAMWLALPRPEIALDTLLAKTNAQTWKSWTQNATSQKVDVKIPKMTLQGNMDLEKLIPTLGAPLTFNQKGDFSPLTKTRPTWIEKAKHKVFVEVNEEGTEAAAVTEIEAASNAASPLSESFVFVADRPFLMAIQERQTGSILFLCRVMTP